MIMILLPLLFAPIWATFIGVSTFILIYWYVTRNYNFWKEQGIPFVKPSPLWGFSLLSLRKSYQDVLMERFKNFGRVYGYFEARTPVLNVGDPDLLKEIMVKDFSSFTDRRNAKSGDKLIDNMVSSLSGEDWKRVRSIITPTFSTGKIKKMLDIFKTSSKTLCKNFENTASKGNAVDLKKLYGAFTMDVIASAAFSTKIDSHNDPDNEFVKTARSAFSPKISLRLLLLVMFPRLRRYSSLVWTKKEGGTSFFSRVTLEIIEKRKKTGQVCNDFLQLLIDTASEIQDEKEENEDIVSNYMESNAGHQIFNTKTSKHLSMDELVAQCVVFFLAGYHTTASTLSFATYLLALNPDVQEKLRQEVDEALKSQKGDLSYEVIQNMKYLDNVIAETLRLYPPAIELSRIAGADHKLGDTGIIVKKGMKLTIPVFALHRDPKFYPDPERFDPDRFTLEEKSKRNPYVFLPFGAGPRNCIGMRFALLEIKTCLAYVISNFKIIKSRKTKVPLQFGIGVPSLLQPKEIFVDLEIRKHSPLVY